VSHENDVAVHVAAGARWLRALDNARKRADGVSVTEMPHFDPTRLLELLHAHAVRYVLIGGVAMRFYDERRLTDDLDICFARERDNCARLASVLTIVHARRVEWPSDVPDILDERALVLGSTFTLVTDTLVTDFGRFDLLGEPAGTRGYHDLAGSASIVEIAGVPVALAAREAMLRMKRTADRPKDRIDVLALEQGDAS
jgi:hypothetical protein